MEITEMVHRTPIPIFPFYWNRDVNSHSLNPRVWLKVNEGIICVKENTYSLTQHTDLTQRNSTGMSNGLLDALKTTKKEANTHTHTHTESVLRWTWSVWREDAGYTQTHTNFTWTWRTGQTRRFHDLHRIQLPKVSPNRSRVNPSQKLSQSDVQHLYDHVMSNNNWYECKIKFNKSKAESSFLEFNFREQEDVFRTICVYLY